MVIIINNKMCAIFIFIFLSNSAVFMLPSYNSFQLLLLKY